MYTFNKNNAFETSKNDILNLLKNRKTGGAAILTMEDAETEVIFFRFKEEGDEVPQQEIHFIEGEKPVIYYVNNAERVHYFYPTNEEYDEILEKFYEGVA